MSIGALNIEITLDNMRFSAALNSSGRQLTNFSGQLKNTTRDVIQSETSIQRWGDSLRDSVATLVLARRGAQLAWDMVGSWGKSMVEAAAQFERAGMLLAGLSNKSTFVDKLKDGKDQLNEITTLAKNAPFSIEAITDAWVKFKSAGIDPAHGALQGLLDATAAFGGTDEVLHRAAIAIQQMAGKGVVSMEELRQQLGEAIPTAMKNMADGMGLSMAKLTKLVSSGTVEARKALSQMFEEFEKSFGGKAVMMMSTFSGKIAQLRTEWSLFASGVVNSSGLFAAVKTATDSLRAALSGPELKQTMIEVARFFSNMIVLVQQVSGFLWAHRDAIVAIVKAYISWKAASLVVGNAAGAWKTMQTAVAATQLVVEQFRLGLAGGFMAAIKAAKLAIVTLFELTPGGWITALITALIAAIGFFTTFRKKVDEGADHLAKFWQTATPKDIDAEIANIGLLQEKIDRLSVAIHQHSGNDEGGNFNMTAAKKRLEDYRAELIGRQSILEAANSGIAKRQEDADKQLFQSSIEQARRRIIDLANIEIQEYRKNQDAALSSKKITDEQATKDLNAFKIKLDKDSSEKYVAYLTSRLKEEGKPLESAGGEQKAVIADRLKDIRDQIDAEKKRSADYIADLINGPNLLTGKNADLPLTKWLAAQDSKIAVLRAKLASDTNSSEGVAAFDAQIAALTKDGKKYFEFDGKLQEITEANVKAMRARIQTTDDLSDAEKQHLDDIQQSKYALDQMNQTVGKTTGDYQVWLNALNSGGIQQQTAEVKQLVEQFDKLKTKMSGSNLAKAQADFDQSLGSAASSAGIQKYLELQGELKDTNLSMITDAHKRFDAERQEMSKTLDAYIEQNHIETEQAQSLRDVFSQLYGAKKQAMEQADDPIYQLADSWQKRTDAMKEATASWISDGVDRLVTFAETGKISFGKMAASILKDILQIIIRAQVANAIMAALPGYGGGKTMAKAPTPNIDSYTGQGGIYTSAGGNVMTQWGPAALKKYAKGGIARRPQVSIFGEGSKPEAYVPLPDGRSIPVTMDTKGTPPAAPDVTFNLINQSGQQVQAEQQGAPRFDGKGYILDVVLKAMGTPGGFRDGMRQSVK